ncbi:MAG: PRD domain-containing protein [Elusimicrobiota bacterium]|jgi:transcriptional antiterminator|nr:PRD domain-containing protein [Elusimicrobiota bacterium]
MERLKILLDNNVIDKETFDFMVVVFKKLTSKYKLTEPSIEMIVTHLAMATQRIKSGQTINPLNEEIIKEVETENLYPQALEIYEDLLSASRVVFPQSEKVFIVTHLLNLIKEGD